MATATLPLWRPMVDPGDDVHGEAGPGLSSSSAVGWGSRVRGRAFRSLVVKRARAAWWTWPLPAFVSLLLVVLLRRPMPLGSLVVYPLQRVENP